MSDQPAEHTSESETTVDDVRRVRERIARESGGDLRKHAAESNRLLAERAAALGLKVVQATPAAPAPSS